MGKLLKFPTVDSRILCVQCGRVVELRRRVYVIPTCYRCLPPPEPLETFEFPQAGEKR